MLPWPKYPVNMNNKGQELSEIEVMTDKMKCQSKIDTGRMLMYLG